MPPMTAPAFSSPGALPASGANTPAPSLAVTPEQVAALKALAAKVVAGPWTVDPADDGGFRVVAADQPRWHVCLVDTDIDEDLDGSAHAAFIAACSPDRILALCQAVERYEAALRTIVGWEDARANLAASYGDTDTVAIAVADHAREALVPTPVEVPR